MAVANVARFERFFRAAANLDVDKDDLKRYNDFISAKVYDMMLIAEGNAKANDRDVLEFRDLPISKGMQSGCTSSARWTTTSSCSRSSRRWPRARRWTWR